MAVDGAGARVPSQRDDRRQALPHDRRQGVDDGQAPGRYAGDGPDPASDLADARAALLLAGAGRRAATPALHQRADRDHGARVGRCPGRAGRGTVAGHRPGDRRAAPSHGLARLRRRRDRQQHQRRSGRAPVARSVLRGLRGARRGGLRARAQAGRNGQAGRAGAAGAGARLSHRHRPGRRLGDHRQPAGAPAAPAHRLQPRRRHAGLAPAALAAELERLSGAGRIGAGRAGRAGGKLYYDTLVFDAGTLQSLVARSAPQLMLGSDYPFNFSERRRSSASKRPASTPRSRTTHPSQRRNLSRPRREGAS